MHPAAGGLGEDDGEEDEGDEGEEEDEDDEPGSPEPPPPHAATSQTIKRNGRTRRENTAMITYLP